MNQEHCWNYTIWTITPIFFLLFPFSLELEEKNGRAYDFLSPLTFVDHLKSGKSGNQWCKYFLCMLHQRFTLGVSACLWPVSLTSATTFSRSCGLHVNDMDFVKYQQMFAPSTLYIWRKQFDALCLVGYLWLSHEDLWIPDTRLLDRDPLQQISLPGVHRPACKADKGYTSWGHREGWSLNAWKSAFYKHLIFIMPSCLTRTWVGQLNSLLVRVLLLDVTILLSVICLLLIPNLVSKSSFARF